MAKAVLLFFVGLLLLIKGGDWFVDGACGLAYRFHVPEILVGATIVSIGTTLPEVMVSATSAVTGHSQIAYGNAIGSVICNTALIAAITMAVRPQEVDRTSLKTPVLFFFAASCFYMAVSYSSGYFSRSIGLIFLGMFIIYMILNLLEAKKQMVPVNSKNDELTDPLIKQLLLLFVGAAFIAIGAKFLVDNGTIIAQFLGVPESVIALTMVALGTSLPELITAITALLKGHSALSLGNIIGANVFNLVLVSGVAVTLAPFSIPQSKLIGGMNASLAVDLPVMLGVMLLLAIPTMWRGRIYRWQGWLLLGIYVAYLIFQFVG